MQELGDRPDRDHPPLPQHRDTVANRIETVEVMGHHEDGEAERVLQSGDEFVEFAGPDRVETGSRLVEKQQSGSSASARASAARLIMPPDSSEGNLLAASGGKPTRSIFSIANSSRRRGDKSRCSRIGAWMFCLHRQAGEQRALLEQDAPALADALALGDGERIDVRRRKLRSGPPVWAADPKSCGSTPTCRRPRRRRNRAPRRDRCRDRGHPSPAGRRNRP